MSLSGLDQHFLQCAAALVTRLPFGTVGVEVGTPAPAEDPVVPLHQSGERVPRVSSQWLNRILACLHAADRKRVSESNNNEMHNRR